MAMNRNWGAWAATLAATAAGCTAVLGIDKDYYPIGEGGGGASSSSSGSGGSGGVGTIGDPCAPKGALACAGYAQKSQLVCGADGKWATNGTCNGDTACDTTPGMTQGTCRPVLMECVGKAPEDVVCVGMYRVECGPDLLGVALVESCPDLCIGGMCVCNSADKRCMGNMPQTCDANGQWQNDAACSAQMPVCVAGKCAVPLSCVGLATTCGPADKESCCAIEPVTGGTYNRSNDPAFPATVSDFRLDRFEITVGRFRAFVAAYPGNTPMPGDGAHPLIPGSGWDATWNVELPATQAALMSALTCSGAPTWTDMPGANENLPINCINWAEAFAFCAWDGGRLPTEAEWNYAAAGGGEQRQYPWGGAPPDTTHAVYDCTGDGSASKNCAFTDILTVGSKPTGDGKWGHADLAGGVAEWNLDWNTSPYPNVPCDNCANLTPASTRAMRGGSWLFSESFLLSSDRSGGVPVFHFDFIGVRCARTP